LLEGFLYHRFGQISAKIPTVNHQFALAIFKEQLQGPRRHTVELCASAFTHL